MHVQISWFCEQILGFVQLLENLAFGEEMLLCAVILKCFEHSFKSLYSIAVENIEIFWNDLFKYLYS